MPDSMPDSIELLPTAGKPQLLFFLLHGGGGMPSDLLGLAAALREAFPRAALLLPAAQAGPARGYWFENRGLTEENRAARVATAMPALVAWIRAQQGRFGMLQTDTALAGFAQGATMALEAIGAQEGLCGRVLSFAGRYARLPERAPEFTTIHLLHGREDPVVSCTHTYAAHERLALLQGDATLDVASPVGHELHPALVARAVQRLQTCIPLRTWRAALGSDRGPRPPPAAGDGHL